MLRNSAAVFESVDSRHRAHLALYHKGQLMSTARIFCPKCTYAPRPTDRWVCVTSCGCHWNTFDTGGQCPSCHKQWHETCCPACVQWSPHDAWYHDEGWSPEKERELEEIGADLVEVGG